MLKSVGRKVQINPGGKTPFKSVVPDGSMKRMFVMKGPQKFYDQVQELANAFAGEWSMADVVRLAVDRLHREYKEDASPAVSEYLKG